MWGKSQEKKAEFIVHVHHDIGSYTSHPMTLENARKRAKKINIRWVKDWYDGPIGGPRPVVRIWEMVESVHESVKGVDPGYGKKRN